MAKIEQPVGEAAPSSYAEYNDDIYAPDTSAFDNEDDFYEEYSDIFEDYDAAVDYWYAHT